MTALCGEENMFLRVTPSSSPPSCSSTISSEASEAPHAVAEGVYLNSSWVELEGCQYGYWGGGGAHGWPYRDSGGEAI